MASLALHCQTVTHPRIYVACLTAYNNGYLNGAWIDATQGEWAIWDEIQSMLKTSPIAGAEEYAIHDYDGFEEIRLCEYTGIETITRLAAFVQEHGSLGAQLYNHFGEDVDEAETALSEQYLGSYASLADYMQELAEETGTVPDHLQYYINWEAMARDAELNGDLFTVQTSFDVVHVFSGR